MSGAAAEITERPRARLHDRLNPILVKEVRQSLRGRYFRFLFWLTLVFATVIGLVVIANAAADDQVDRVGRDFCVAILGVLGVAVHAFVPFSAFLTTSSEWDENTWDLLVISNLRPRQIVLGKLLSTVIQAVLFYSAFGPFLVFAFLLNGVDLLSLAVILPCSALTCAALSLAGIAVASLSRVRLLRFLLMALFGVGLVFVTIVTIFMGMAVVQMPNMLRDADVLVGISAYATTACVIGGLSFATATARFAHEEENRSTTLRVVSVGLVLGAAAWASWAVRELGDTEPVGFSQFFAALTAFIPLTLFTTEEEELRRGVRRQVPRNALVALLWSPFLPGGGRGVLLLALQGLIALATVPLVLRPSGSAPTTQDLREGLLAVGSIYGYLVLHIAVISGLASFFPPARRARTAVRWTILVSVPVALFLPALFGLFFGMDNWMELRHPFNPLMTLFETYKRVSITLVAAWALLGLGAMLAVLLNARRVLAGVSEVLLASRARREREHAQAQS